jgi:hypothetical protein
MAAVRLIMEISLEFLLKLPAAAISEQAQASDGVLQD